MAEKKATVWDAIKDIGTQALKILEQATVKQVAQVPAVQTAAAEAAQQKGKDILWIAAPFVLIVVILLFFMKR